MPVTANLTAHEGRDRDEFDMMMDDIVNHWKSTRSKAQRATEPWSNVDYRLGDNHDVCRFEKQDYPLWRVQCEVSTFNMLDGSY